MPPSRFHQFAAAVMALGGAALAITAFGLVVARGVLDANLPGVVARPQDVALLGDLIAITPFIGTIAAINLVAAFGLATGRSWAPRVARWLTGLAVTAGVLGLLLLIAANGPVPSTQVARASDPQGFAILSAFVCLYAWAAVALRLPTEPQRPFVAAAAA